MSSLLFVVAIIIGWVVGEHTGFVNGVEFEKTTQPKQLTNCQAVITRNAIYE